VAGPTPSSWEVDPGRARAYEVAPGVWQLRLPLAWSDVPHVNAYVLERDDGIVLVDCGSAGHPSNREALSRALDAAGHQVADVRVLLCTHAHSDHFGLAGWVIAASSCEFLMHPDTAVFYDGMREPGRIEAARRGRAAREGVPDRWLDDFADVGEEADGAIGPTEPTGPLRQGVTLAAAGTEWTVVETPGHAPNHVSLVAPDAGLVITGDLVAPVFVPWWDYGYSADPVGEFLDSLELLGASGPFRLALPGHGRAIADLPAVLAEHRAGTLARLEATRVAVAAGPASGFEIAARVSGDLGEPGDPYCFHQVGLTICCLRRLRTAGVVARRLDAEGRYRYVLRSGPPDDSST
jgi:glyoxylase-like metal-dependent hydrolase (beta-lactamase superfamily II)